jgi:hypothetical protein
MRRSQSGTQPTTSLTKTVPETALNQELTEHLGHDKHTYSPGLGLVDMLERRADPAERFALRAGQDTRWIRRL